MYNSYSDIPSAPQIKKEEDSDGCEYQKLIFDDCDRFTIIEYVIRKIGEFVYFICLESPHDLLVIRTHNGLTVLYAKSFENICNHPCTESKSFKVVKKNVSYGYVDDSGKYMRVVCTIDFDTLTLEKKVMLEDPKPRNGKKSETETKTQKMLRSSKSVLSFVLNSSDSDSSDSKSSSSSDSGSSNRSDRSKSD